MTDSCWYKSKRMRVDDGCNNNTNVATKDSKQWTYSGDTSLVEPEILEDMGVSMLADGESSQENKIPLLKTQECTISPKKFDKNKIRKSENALKKKENYSFESNTANRLDPLEEVTNNKELNLGDEAISFSTINNESGYLSRIDSGNFSDSKENLNKEDSNDALDKQELDQFFLNRRKKRPSIMGEDRFNKLSDEIVLLILKFLSKKCLVRSMLVCKRWCQIAKDEVLWTRLDLGGKVLNQGTLGYIIPRGVQILRLAQAEIAEPTFIDIPNEIYDNEPCKLQYLDLSMAVISVNDLSQLLSKCKYLKKLSLEKCTLDKSCCEAISQNSDLEALNLTMCDGLDISCVEDLIKLKRLDCLNMAWCGLDLESMSLLCKSLTSRINRLNIAGCRKTLLDENVMDLVSSCPDLVELDLSDCTSLTINVVNNLMTLSKLEHLSLSRCYSIPTMMFAKLTLMPRLRYLDIFGLMPDEMIKSFQAKCDSIEINKYLYSAIARPTVGVRRTSIWNLRVRD